MSPRLAGFLVLALIAFALFAGVAFALENHQEQQIAPTPTPTPTFTEQQLPTL